jgi:dihydrofolate reductase
MQQPMGRCGLRCRCGQASSAGDWAQNDKRCNSCSTTVALPVDHWGGDHHDGVPIFVPSHRPPGPSVAKYPLVTYVTDGIASAMAQAKVAAGDRNVLVHGAYTAQTAIEAGVLDELQIHQVPVPLGRGRRLFDVLPATVELAIIRVIDTPAATHIRYRIIPSVR